LPAAFFAAIDPPPTVDLSALQQQVATLQQQATASQQQVATLQAQAAASQQQVAGLQAAVAQLQAVVATMSGTIPANLTALSNALSTNNGISLTGATTFIPSACDYLNLGDVFLSVNGYGPGALPADGRILPIASHMALFALIGTNFGGDGATTFGLPDLRSFTPQGLQYSICGTAGFFPSHVQ
jgi:Phage Tail Collar Domain